MKEWIEYERLEPFGDRRADWQAASICSAFANVMLGLRGSKKHFATKDFLLEFKKEERKSAEPEWKRMQVVARNYAMMANAMIRADEKKKQRREHERRRPRHRDTVRTDRARR